MAGLEVGWVTVLRIVTAVLVTVVGWVLLKVALTYFGRRLGQSVRLVLQVASPLFYAGMLLIGFLVAGIDLTNVATLVSAVTVAIGFAAQEPLSNWVSAVFISGAGVVAIGDVVDIGEGPGVVRGNDGYFVKIEYPDRRVSYVTNATLYRGVITNYSSLDFHRVEVELPISAVGAYDARRFKNRVRTAVNRAIAADVRYSDNLPPQVKFRRVEGDAHLFTLWVYIKDALDQIDVVDDMLTLVLPLVQKVEGLHLDRITNVAIVD